MQDNTELKQEYLYGGISGIELAIEHFDLGEGVEVRKTFAHLFSANMVAFAPPIKLGSHHGGPWKAAKGGFGYDVTVEIKAPAITSLGKSFDAKEIIWWIAALLRLAYFPYISVPVTSTHSFKEIAQSNQEPTLMPFETEGRIFMPADGHPNVLDTSHLEWVKNVWVKAGQLLDGNAKFYSALKAFDAASLRGRASSSLLAMWGGLEQLFAPSTAELRFRVAALLASYLESPGTTRLELYKDILKLYNQRSIAAHTAQEIEVGPLASTYVLMRNALIKMINTNAVPTQDDLERLLFSAGVTSE